MRIPIVRGQCGMVAAERAAASTFVHSQPAEWKAVLAVSAECVGSVHEGYD